VPVAENENVIQTLVPDRTDEALGERILPGAVRRCKDFIDTHVLGPVPKLLAVDLVTIAEKIGGRGVVWKCLDVLGHVKVDDASATAGDAASGSSEKRCARTRRGQASRARHGFVGRPGEDLLRPCV
jgi:hypothetical protein